MSAKQNQAEKQLSPRIKEIPKFLKQQFGTLEQEPPNHPSFLFVVLLSGAAIIIIFIVAIIILHLGGASLTRHSFHRHPTSQLIMPASSASPVRWSA